MKQLYAGCDLHGNNNLIGIIDGDGKRVFEKKLLSDLSLVRDTLTPFQGELVGIAVESTYNWYWLVDGLMEKGYKVHLANPSAIQRYSGLKHSNDQDDAFWLAEMLRLGILPEGYIYPKEERPIRDLLRKRGHLVRLILRFTGSDQVNSLIFKLIRPKKRRFLALDRYFRGQN